jgi:predicted DNA-binding protein with PD1-like motif
MKTQLIFEHQGRKTYAILYEKGDEFISGLEAFAREQRVNSCHISAIGAFSDALLGYFDRQQMDYKQIPVAEQVEVLSINGNITSTGGEYKIHAHAVLGRADGSALGGHLLEAHVWPTLEAVVEESPKHLQRRKDLETGLPLLDFGKA